MLIPNMRYVMAQKSDEVRIRPKDNPSEAKRTMVPESRSSPLIIPITINKVWNIMTINTAGIK